MKKAFTMIELVFVIVVIGILASIAIPRFAATRDDADISSAKATIAAVRCALANERQLRVLRGDFTAITSIDNDGIASTAISTFSADKGGAGVSRSVLETQVPTCSGLNDTACWRVSGTTYTYVMPSGVGGSVDFTLAGGQFNCDANDANCRLLTQ